MVERLLCPQGQEFFGYVLSLANASTRRARTCARIDQGERALSLGGVLVDSGRADRGPVKNAWTTVLNQYRPHARALAAELGPASASRIDRPAGAGAGAEDDPFD